MKNKFTNEEMERILGSLNGMQRAGAPDFFYTRLLAKMEPAAEKKAFFMLRPAFITAVLSVFLIINVFSLLNINKTEKADMAIQQQKQPTIESFAKAYNLNTESVYE
jgi:hypothetical protein